MPDKKSLLLKDFQTQLLFKCFVVKYPRAIKPLKCTESLDEGGEGGCPCRHQRKLFLNVGHKIL